MATAPGRSIITSTWCRVTASIGSSVSHSADGGDASWNGRCIMPNANGDGDEYEQEQLAELLHHYLAPEDD